MLDTVSGQPVLLYEGLAKPGQRVGCDYAQAYEIPLINPQAVKVGIGDESESVIRIGVFFIKSTYLKHEVLNERDLLRPEYWPARRLRKAS